jgi:2-polyprenyl-3-methyl-5-hydroxy-6-metoxy-1,4-benzoquinol methylase
MEHIEFDPQNVDWNQIYSGSASDYEPPDEMLVSIIDTLPVGKALDVGCGAGGLVVALAQRGFEVTGVDIAPKGIAAARKVLAKRGIQARLEVADATSWQPNDQYDLITNSFALPVVREQWAQVFRMVRKALAPGGTVLLKDFDTSMKRHAAFAQFDLLTVEELLDAFNGFDIVRAEIVDTPPHDHDGSGANVGEHWTAALLQARKPIG